MMNKLIELKNLTKNFDDQQVLRGINLDIYEKEFLTLLGPSGCGKTTTLRIIAGFEEPSDGEVLFNGIEISKLPPYKREVNTVFQKYALFPHLNVAENIGFGLNLKKVDKTVIAQKVERMLKMVGLEGFGKRDVTLLSGGQQQRVAIARALVNEPKVLLLDEPLGALDAKIRKQMQVELKKIQQEVGITFIYVTHDQEEALSMSDTVVVMNNGEIQQIGSPTDIYNEPENRFVAGFIGESNIIEGTMIRDYLVTFDGFENYLQRMSGIATYTKQVSKLLEGSKVTLLDTRKTTPNCRVFEKYAVRIGGGCNHRYNLSDGVLLKDNHIGAAGSVAKAVAMAKEYAPFVRKIEIEVETMEQVKEAVEAGADIIMLDNMTPEMMKEAVELIAGRAQTECSGNITKENIAKILETGVDFVSSGALTHSAPILDISMKNLHAI